VARRYFTLLECTACKGLSPSGCRIETEDSKKSNGVCLMSKKIYKPTPIKKIVADDEIMYVEEVSV
jgi:hypothetical protein